MSIDANQSENKNKLPAADTGNASNPTPHDKRMEPQTDEQLLNKKAEKYLRESANIEDEPDPQDELNAEETISTEKETESN